MMPAQLAALLLPLLPAGGGEVDPDLVIEYSGSQIGFRVQGPDTSFLGGVLLSFDDRLCHYFQGLPPLLCDFAVLGVGVGEGRFSVFVDERALPPGIWIYAQGVIAHAGAVQATAVEELILDGSKPASDG